MNNKTSNLLAITLFALILNLSYTYNLVELPLGGQHILDFTESKINYFVKFPEF